MGEHKRNPNAAKRSDPTRGYNSLASLKDVLVMIKGFELELIAQGRLAPAPAAKPVEALPAPAGSPCE